MAIFFSINKTSSLPRNLRVRDEVITFFKKKKKALKTQCFQGFWS